MDLIAISAWPLRSIVRDKWEPDNVSLIYLLRIFRIGKLVTIMNLQGFTYFMRGVFRSKLAKLIQKRSGRFDDHSEDNNKIYHQIILIKLFQVLQLIVFIFMLAYFMGTLWYVMTKHSTDKED